ncbi:class I SAM-dependent methyltransferase [Kitasatospora sp. NBC_01287]|uniref:class I SAM-dependent methyltransferase n=1 Tax=Kitasatospora sp. NBC_01287 TaxID=2903573 RepID=UPI002252B111|nr:class I SAM-dependent methyltransferase [Kitasatospora sp. NBC_01287]MCX4750835.1 class I SAM-dependent methyltransferase [Kitasatospora sp. NBC_01287]
MTDTQLTGPVLPADPGLDTEHVSWEDWQRSWDRQQEWYLPDREERFRVMLDVVEAVGGPAPRVLDLACGTGSISRRLLARLPGASSVGVDLDPALLAIAEGSFGADPRLTLVTADLRDPGWAAALPAGPFDAVVTATALHWLNSQDLLRLYRDLTGLLRPGGVFLNADRARQPDTPLLNALDQAQQERRQEQERSEGVLDWAQWWQAAAADPRLAAPVAARSALYRDHKDGELHPAEWHTARLVEVGFAEAGVAWRSVSDALVTAIR